MARGAEDALAELYDRFGGVAYGVALRILRDPALAQDAVQDAFLAAWRTAASFDPARGNASTWLLTTRAPSRRRPRRARGALARADVLDESAPVARASTDEAAALRRPGSRRAAALAQLPSDQREALLTAYCSSRGELASGSASGRSSAMFRDARDVAATCSARTEP